METRRKTALAGGSAVVLLAGVVSFAAVRSWGCQVVDGYIGEPLPTTAPPDGRPLERVTMAEPLVRPARGWECARKALNHGLSLR